MDYDNPMSWWMLAAMMPSFAYGMAMVPVLDAIHRHSTLGRPWLAKGVVRFLVPVAGCLLWSVVLVKKGFSAVELVPLEQPSAAMAPSMAALTMVVGVAIHLCFSKKKQSV